MVFQPYIHSLLKAKDFTNCAPDIYVHCFAPTPISHCDQQAVRHEAFYEVDSVGQGSEIRNIHRRDTQNDLSLFMTLQTII